jgi:hypothetical protein
MTLVIDTAAGTVRVLLEDLGALGPWRALRPADEDALIEALSLLTDLLGLAERIDEDAPLGPDRRGSGARPGRELTYVPYEE